MPKLWDLDCELLRDVGRPRAERKLPSPGASVVYDLHYVVLSTLGLIRWAREYEGCSSFSDHYILSLAGERVLERMKTEYPPLEVADA